MGRMEQIQKLLHAEPNDVFLNFSLAMEYQSAGRTDDALGQYDRTIEVEPNYLAAHVRKSELLLSARRFDEARTALERAAAVAATTGDHHTLDHINQMRSHLP